MNAKEFLKSKGINYDHEATGMCAYVQNAGSTINAMEKLLDEYCELRLSNVSNRFSASEMAEWFHNNYEEIAKAEGWQTQDKCKVEFKDLPEKNKSTMIKVCERWLNGW